MFADKSCCGADVNTDVFEGLGGDEIQQIIDPSPLAEPSAGAGNKRTMACASASAPEPILVAKCNQAETTVAPAIAAAPELFPVDTLAHALKNAGNAIGNNGSGNRLKATEQPVLLGHMGVVSDDASTLKEVSSKRADVDLDDVHLKDDACSECTKETLREDVPAVEAKHQLKSQDSQNAQSSTPSFVEVCLLLYSIFYAAVSRVPFTLFAIYMIDVLKFTYFKAASTLGLYCFGRLLGAHLAGTFVGSATMIFGTVAGGIAWAAINYLTPILGEPIFICGSFLLGFTETVTGLDTMLKIESLIMSRHPDYTQRIFRSQLIFTCIGVFLAYMGGGCLYQYRGLQDVGDVCIVFTVINVIILCLVFWKRSIYRRTVIRFGDIQDAIAKSSQETSAGSRRVSRMSCSGTAVNPRQRVSMEKVDMLEVEFDNADGTKTNRVSFANNAILGQSVEDEEDDSHSNPMSSNVFLGSVVACFFFTTLGISTQFAISALYWNAVWSVGADVVGTIMAVGEGLGVCCLMLFSQPAVFNSPLTKYFGKPVNVLNACLGMGVMMYVLTLNNKAACVVGSVCVHMFNVCVHSFQAELIGICATGENFSKWIARSYVVKRLANCVCVFGSLIFFEQLGPHASYYAFGAGLSLYAAVLGAIYLKLGVWPFQLQRSVRKGSAANFTPLQKRLSLQTATPQSGVRVSFSA